MKKRATIVLGAALLAAVEGCSSGYPDTKERIENVDGTIQKYGLAGEPNPDRDRRFEVEVHKNPTLGPATTPPPK